jgi:hypothetical protein
VYRRLSSEGLREAREEQSISTTQLCASEQM